MKRWLILLAVCATLAASSARTLAAGITYQGISITPAIEQLVLNPNQTSASYKIRLDNNNSYPISLQATSLDFKSLNDSGGLAFIATGASDLQHKYGLAKYIGLPNGSIDLPAHGGQFIEVAINNQTDLSPGGHYAAVLFKLAAAPAPVGKNSLQSNQVVSSLIFIRKSGGAIYKLELKNLTLHRSFSWLSWPSRLDGLFYNGGNVQTAPVGLAELNGQHAQLNINSSLVLPGSTRLIGADLTGIKKPFWPRRYQIDVKYHPDEDGSPGGAALTFMYVGWPFLLFSLVVASFFLAVLPRSRRNLWQKAKMPFKYIYRTLVGILKYLDYLGGLALQKWDKRRVQKAKKH